MRTSKDEKIKAQRYADLWAAAQLKTFSIDEILERLERFRTFYVMAWEECLSRGAVHEAGQFYSMISNITQLFMDLAAEQVRPELVLAQSVMRVPLMLAPMERLDFAHLLDDKAGVHA